MVFHTFGKESLPAMLLIHGALTPWQIWEPQIDAFLHDHHIIVPELDGHTEGSPSEFVSLDGEAQAIEQYLSERGITKLSAVCGLSLGGAIANRLWARGRTDIEALVLDGAPLVAFPSVAHKIMINNYISIIHRSKERDPKVIESFKKNFLPEKYLEYFLPIADNMSDDTIRNFMNAVFGSRVQENVKSSARILFLHGTKGNEHLSKKSAVLMKKHYPHMQIKCYKGDPHVYKAIYEPQIWINDVRTFLNG